MHNLVIITIDTIRNIPIDKRDKFEQARYEKDRWLQSVKDIQMRFEKTKSQIAKTGGAGVATGVGIATLAP